MIPFIPNQTITYLTNLQGSESEDSPLIVGTQN
jgi:hypothetical protein